MPSEYANELMGRVGLDTTDWKKGITELNAGIKHIETGFQVTAALMDDWSHNSDGLKKRVDTLNDKLALQKQKLDLLTKAYNEEVAANGASSKAAENLAKKMYATKAEIEKTKESLNYYAQAEKDVTDQTKKMIAQIEKSGEKLMGLGDKLSGAGNKLTVGVTAPVVAAGTAIYKYGSDLTEAKNKTESTFGYMSDAVKEWAQDSLTSFGMAKATAYDAAALYGDMATSMDLPKSKAAEMSMKLVELSADLSSFKNISLEQSQNALKGIFTGETESLKNLGIVMTETQLKAYAMSSGFEKNYADMTQAEKVQLRYQYVLDASKNAIGDYARTNGEAAGQVRLLPEALKELASSFNDNVAPAITPAITAVNNAIISFGQLDDGTKKIVVSIAAMAAAVGPLVTVTGKTITFVGKMKKGYASLRTALMQKTQATVADTAAENSHAAALTKTDKAATKTTKSIKNIGTAAKGSTMMLTAAAVAIAAFLAIANKYHEAQMEYIDEEYDKKIKLNNKTYDTQISNLEKEVEINEQALLEKQTSINKFYDNKIDRLDDDLKAQKKAIEKEKDLYEKAHEARMEQLEAERALKLSNINTEANAQISNLQSQIDALDALTEAEEKAAQEKENEHKLTELQQAIAAAETYAEKVDAEKEYNDFVLNLEREKVKEARELEKNALLEQINNINTEAEKKRDAVNDEYEAAKKLEDDKRELAQQGYSDRLEALETFIEDQTKEMDELRDSELSKIQAHTEKVNLELQSTIDKFNEIKISAEEALKTEKKFEKESVNVFSGEYWNKESEKRTLSFGENTWAMAVGGEGGRYYADTIPEWVRIMFEPGYLAKKLGVIPENAEGTNYWRGGLTWVNEEGGEIMNLPRGTQIIPHDVSMEIARAAGRASVTNNSTNNTNNTYNYGAQQQVNVFSVDGKVIAREIVPGVSVRLSNDIYGRRRSGGR